MLVRDNTVRFAYLRYLVWFVLGMCVIGCTSANGPDCLTINSSEYIAAFDSAVDAARSHGMIPVVRDRRAGIVDTEPRKAGSILEPWRTDNSSGQALENTLSLQRRRARFEFSPVESQLSSTRGEEHYIDLTTATGKIELRVWVYLERAHMQGVRRNTWTRKKTTHAQLSFPEDEGGLTSGTNWTPIARDMEFERRLLSIISQSLNGQ